MKSLALHHRPSYDNTLFEDEPTGVIETLGSLVSTPALVVEETTLLAEVRMLLIEHRVPAIAVSDRDDNLRGVITRTDVLRTIDPDAVAGDAMSSFVFALPALSSIEKAAALMAFEQIGQIIVTGSGGELVGMVSALDIARYYATLTGYLRE
jgi:CBS domain-containing protein